MKTANVNVILNQGTDFELTFAVPSDVGLLDVTGYSFKGQMRESTAITSPVSAEFIFQVLNQVTFKGQVKWSLPRAVSEALLISAANANDDGSRRMTPFFYDIKMTDTVGKVSRIFEGTVYVSPSTTHEVTP